MKKILFFIAFISFYLPVIGQDIMTVLPDSGSFSPDYIGINIVASDINLKGLKQNLHFNFLSPNNGFEMSHGMNTTGLSNIPNIGVGVDETYGNLFINFVRGSIGYIDNTLDWHVGLGAGGAVTLNRTKTLVLRGYVDLSYMYISYFLGTYSDTTLTGFLINGANIGTYVKNVKYVNSAFCIDPNIELFYRGKKWDFFVGVGYNLTVYYNEKIDFYRTTTPIEDGIYYNSGNPVIKGAIIPGNYIIQLGLVKEFEL
jgi:hypothetical protein